MNSGWYREGVRNPLVPEVCCVRCRGGFFIFLELCCNRVDVGGSVLNPRKAPSQLEYKRGVTCVMAALEMVNRTNVMESRHQSR